MRSPKVKHAVLQGPQGRGQPGHSAAVWAQAARGVEPRLGPVSAMWPTAHRVHPKESHKPHPTNSACPITQEPGWSPGAAAREQGGERPDVANTDPSMLALDRGPWPGGATSLGQQKVHLAPENMKGLFQNRGRRDYNAGTRPAASSLAWELCPGRRCRRGREIKKRLLDASHSPQSSALRAPRA